MTTKQGWMVLVSSLVAVTVWAADTKPKGAPESVILPPATVKTLQDKAKDARIARLEAEKLSRELELGKAQLEKLIEEAKKTQGESERAFVAACSQAGIPASDVNNYEGAENEKGEFVLKRKAAQAKP